MIDNLKTYLQQESMAERSKRMIPATLFGALIATAYVLTFYFVNVYTFFTLPLAIDWVRLMTMWLEFSLAFALFGAIAAWFTEEYAGIVGGGILLTVLLGIFFLLSSGARNGTLTLQSIIMALPLIGVCALAAWGFRWAANRYLAIQQEGESADRRKRLAKHVLTIVLIGLIPGILMRMDLPAQQSLQKLHELLQAAPDDPSVWPQLPLKRVPELQNHFGVDYKFYVRQSPRSAGALDVTVRFSDGFTMACFLPIDTGTDFITQCNEGAEVQASS